MQLPRPVITSDQLTVESFADLPETQSIENPWSKDLANPEFANTPRELYRPTQALVESVNLAIALGRPLLLQGEPGSGKTRLAYAVAYALRLPLEIVNIKSTSRAQDLLYTYDALKRLYDAQILPRSDAQSDPDSALAPARYVTLGPLGRAIARAQEGRRSVVLIDEIDKADLDFPNDLLWELEHLEFQVAEVPGKHHKVSDPQVRPIVFVTNNQEKALPAAFLRRCIFHLLDFPPRDELEAILKLHRIANEPLSKRAIDIVLALRELNLEKHPGLSELLDWVGYLDAVRMPPERLGELPHIGALLKQQDDQQRARRELPQ